MKIEKISDIIFWTILSIIILGIVYIIINPSIIDNYEFDCLNEIANDVCISYNYSYGKISKALLGNIGDLAIIKCYSDLRDITPSKEYLFLDEELDKCKKR